MIDEKLEPKYFEHEDVCIRFLEWKALEILSGNPSHQQYPDYAQRWAFWSDGYREKAKDWHKQLLADVGKKEVNSVDQFYKRLAQRLSKKKTKVERKKLGQEAYQREQLGDAFIDDKQLVSKAKQKATELAFVAEPDTCWISIAKDVASEHADQPLTDAQLQVLADLMRRRVEKLRTFDLAEVKLLDMDDKDAWFLWGKIKRQYAKDDSIALSVRDVASMASVGKDKARALPKKLIKAGLLRLISKGKASQTKRMASLYQRIL